MQQCRARNRQQGCRADGAFDTITRSIAKFLLFLLAEGRFRKRFAFVPRLSGVSRLVTMRLLRIVARLPAKPRRVGVLCVFAMRLRRPLRLAGLFARRSACERLD